VLEAARQYIQAGLCCLPAKRADKRPIGRWKRYQERLPTETELDLWPPCDAICILTGKVSGNLEFLDFDGGGELYEPWRQKVNPDLLARLVIEQSPSGGKHVVYRCEAEICGNIKLAQRNGKTLIETRGEGGLCLCAPTPGYVLLQGDLALVPTITEDERNELLGAAYDLGEHVEPVQAMPDAQPETRPGDDYNRRGDVRDVLRRHGWQYVKDDGPNEQWRRPGKSHGTSATLHKETGVFYVFSSNAYPLEHGKGHSPYAVLAALDFNGDYSAASRQLAREGYGESPESPVDDGIDLSGIIGAPEAQRAAESEQGAPTLPIFSLTDGIGRSIALKQPLIYGVLRVGETMNVIAAPKVGKSCLAMSMATSVAAGMDWLGFDTEPGRVLHIDNELHRPTLMHRYQRLAGEMGLSPELFTHNLDCVCLRGKLMDLNQLAQFFRTIGPGHYKLIIIDAFYRALPAGCDENDNNAIAHVYNLIDSCAEALQAAFVLIHHTSKGNQSGKAVTDVGAGAGSQSRAADTHLILRPHEEEGVVIVEAAARSFAPLEPIALKLDWPLFSTVDNVDASALLGLAKDKTKRESVDLEAFVDHCIAPIDPASKAAIAQAATERYSMSRRRAEELLSVAIEQKAVASLRVKSSIKFVKCRAGAVGDKALHVAALLSKSAPQTVSEIALEVDVSDRYVRQIMQQLSTFACGTEAELDGTEFRDQFRGDEL